MGIFEIIILAVSLSMDAFAVALCKGLAIKKINLKSCLTVGLWFGIFQGVMPLIGYLLGNTFADKITAIDHWIAFILLALIGANMIKEALSKECDSCNDSLGFKSMLIMAIATSIDALAIGVSFAFTEFKASYLVYIAFILIGIITCTLSAIGVKIGSIFGVKYKSKAELIGGIILIILGFKILLEGLNLI